MAQEGAVFADCTGYTEWVSNTSPVISIGWDWVFQHSQIGGAGYKRVSKPKTNLMLVDMQQCDLRSFKTAALVERIIDEIDWQKVVQNWITTRYAAMPVNSDSCV